MTTAVSTTKRLELEETMAGVLEYNLKFPQEFPVRSTPR